MQKIKKCIPSFLIIILALFLGINVKAADVQEINEETLSIQEFIVNPSDVGYTNEEITLSVTATGGKGGYQYRFYVIRDGNEILLQDFSENNFYIWRPYTMADYEVCVEAKDETGECVTRSEYFSVVNRQMSVSFTQITPEYSVESRGVVNLSAKTENGLGESQYRFFVIRDGREIILQDYSTNESCTWSPYTTGKYQLCVEAKDAVGNYAIISSEYEVLESSLYIQDFAVSPTESALKNTEVNISAVAEGGSGDYLYSYYVIRDGREILLRDYESESTYTWHPYTPANYQVGVKVKDSSGNVVVKELEYKIKDTNLKIDTIEVSPSGQAAPGDTITITANVSEGQGIYQYRFYVVRKGREITLQPFSTENTCIWKPYTIANYEIFVEVKDEIGREISKPISYKIQESELKIDALKAGVDGNVYAGKEVISASVSGGVAPYTCQFYVIRNNNPEDKIILKDFSEDLEFLWKPYTLAEYELFAVVRDSSGCEVVESVQFEVVPATLKLKELMVGNNKIAQSNQKVELAVDYEVFGDIGTLEYKYYAIREGQEIVLRDYSVVPNAIWKPYTPAFYQVFVAIRDKNGNVYEESLDFEVIPQELYIDSFSIGADINVTPYTKVPLSVQAHGGSGKLQYKFYVIRAGQEIVLQDFSEKNKCEWIPYTIAGYKVCVDVKDERGLIATTTKELNVIYVDLIGKKIDEIKLYTFVPYVWGGTTPSGWDCSGFTKWALGTMGVSIPRLAHEQAAGGVYVDPFDISKWKPGDIICYSEGGIVSHVALYLGDNELMHALSPRWGTIIQDVEYYEWWDPATYRVAVKRYI